MGIDYRRVFPMEARAVAQDMEDALNISGFAAVFDAETVISDMYIEVIRKGAFAKTIQESDNLLLWNHDSSRPLARQGTGTLVLDETDEGLSFTAELSNTTWGRDAYEAIRRGDVQGMSFAFEPVKETWTEPTDGNGGMPIRELLEVRLFEISPVTFPAYEQTEVEARSVFDRYLKTRKDERITPEPVRADHSRAEAGIWQRELLKLKTELAYKRAQWR